METNLILGNVPKKEDIDLIVSGVIEKILSGDTDPLKIEINLKIMEDMIHRIRKDDRVKDCIINEADKYPEKSFVHLGMKITKTQKTTYGYGDDSEWNELDKEKKAREKMLKGLTADVVDPVSGEIIKPATVSITQYLKIEVEK